MYLRMFKTPWLKSAINKGELNKGQKGLAGPAEQVPLRKLGGLWHGLAISQQQTMDGKPYRDTRDMKEGFNCVIPYGEWEGGEVMLWEIGMRVEVRRGEALFFQGNVILHNAHDITGSRNCVDLFIHQNVVTLDEQNRKHKWGGDKMGKNQRQKKD